MLHFLAFVTLVCDNIKYSKTNLIKTDFYQLQGMGDEIEDVLSDDSSSSSESDPDGTTIQKIEVTIFNSIILKYKTLSFSLRNLQVMNLCPVTLHEATREN